MGLKALSAAYKADCSPALAVHIGCNPCIQTRIVIKHEL